MEMKCVKLNFIVGNIKQMFRKRKSVLIFSNGVIPNLAPKSILLMYLYFSQKQANVREQVTWENQFWFRWFKNGKTDRTKSSQLFRKYRSSTLKPMRVDCMTCILIYGNEFSEGESYFICYQCHYRAIYRLAKKADDTSLRRNGDVS